jgi:FkbM family methyltransferase
LKKNIEINQVRAKAFNYIISDQSGIKMKIKTATLKDYNTYGSNKVELANNDFDNNFEEVEVKKIDDFTFDKKISFMKIDIQGYDLMALKGSIKTILKHKMPIIFEYTPEFSEELKYTFADFETFIDEINYYVVKKIDYYNYLILPK